MNDQQRTNNISSGVIAAVSVAVIVVSGGIAWFSSHSSNTSTPTNPSETIKQPIEQSNSQQGNEQT
ncbi:MAG: spore germination protein, partial [Dolichospermum sp.]